MDEMYVGKFDTVKRFLGVARGDRKRITKCLKEKRRKVDIIAAVTKHRAIYMCPLFWGKDSYSGFKEKKIRLLSWGTFCIDQNVLLKTMGSGTVVKLCVDRRRKQ